MPSPRLATANATSSDEKHTQIDMDHVEATSPEPSPYGEDIENKLTKETILACIVRLPLPS